MPLGAIGRPDSMEGNGPSRGDVTNGRRRVRSAGRAPVELSAAQETVLALALREAVTNVVRHAGAEALCSDPGAREWLLPYGDCRRRAGRRAGGRQRPARHARARRSPGWNAGTRHERRDQADHPTTGDGSDCPLRSRCEVRFAWCWPRIRRWCSAPSPRCLKWKATSQSAARPATDGRAASRQGAETRCADHRHRNARDVGTGTGG